jgi:hypothetical protein
MIYLNRAQAKRMTGLSYLGGINTSSKIKKGLKYDEMTYILYLAPADRSGYEVCPMRSSECTAACLNESGHNRIDIHDNVINNARITKTKLFFEQRAFFMGWLQDEIAAAKAKAHAAGKRFSVRLNGTSDLSPEQFHLNGKNILEMFPEVQFYDYTKVAKRIQLTKKYSNYDLTFSYSGTNAVQCQDALLQNVRVAVVFEKLPTEFWGHPVIDGDLYDMRYIDESSVIVGLKYKKVRNKIDYSLSTFVISKEKVSNIANTKILTNELLTTA